MVDDDSPTGKYTSWQAGNGRHCRKVVKDYVSSVDISIMNVKELISPHFRAAWSQVPVDKKWGVCDKWDATTAEMVRTL